MLLLLTVLGIVLTVVGYKKCNYEIEGMGIGCIITFGLAALVVCGFLTFGMTIDDKVALYETKNKQIDSQIRSIVESNYGSTTFENIQDINADTLVNVYPELTEEPFVALQMEVYYSNGMQIMWLQEEKLNLKPSRWWLYFGS